MRSRNRVPGTRETDLIVLETLRSRNLAEEEDQYS
jgi:hypothetical protein